MSTQVTFDHEYRGKELNSKEKEDYERKIWYMILRRKENKRMKN